MKFLLALFLAASATNALAADPEADRAFAGRQDLALAARALELYEKAAAQNPSSAEAQWKAASAAHWIADRAENRKEKLRMFQKGIDHSRAAVKLDPDSPQAHFWLGANYGSFGEAKGVLKSLALVGPIRKEMQELIRIDDKFQGGGAYRVLGIVDYKVPPFAGGSKKRALENLKKALAIDPTNAFTHFYLAEYYAVVGKKDQAREHLKILETLPAAADVDAADLAMIQEKGRAFKKERKL